MLIPYRNKIYKDAWDKYKGIMTMKDLADIFRVDLPHLFIVLKNETAKEKHEQKIARRLGR